MKIGYFGSPEISAKLLERLISDPNHVVSLVVSNADSRKGRSKKLLATPVSALAQEHNIPLFRFENLKDKSVYTELKKWDVDLFVVFAYGKLIPENIFSLPKNGSINLHASLLPKLRGASPIQSCLLEGYKKTGWTVQFIGKKMDAGAILCQNQIEILANESAGDLTKKMLPSGIELVVDCLSQFENLSKKAYEQDESEATHCSKIQSKDSYIQWSKSALDIHNQIRGMNPSPGTRTLLNNDLLKIWKSQIILDTPSNWKDAVPGSFGRGITKSDLWVRCGDGILSIEELQPVGRKKLTAQDFLNGYRTKGFVILTNPEI